MYREGQSLETEMKIILETERLILREMVEVDFVLRGPPAHFAFAKKRRAY